MAIFVLSRFSSWVVLINLITGRYQLLDFSDIPSKMAKLPKCLSFFHLRSMLVFLNIGNSELHVYELLKVDIDFLLLLLVVTPLTRTAILMVSFLVRIVG